MSSQEYFTLHEKFIDWIQKKDNEMYSTLKVDRGSNTLSPSSLDNRKLEILASNSRIIPDGRVLYKDIIYQHQSGFYIYLSKINDAEIEFSSKIYYKQKQHDEIMLFLKTFKKI